MVVIVIEADERGDTSILLPIEVSGREKLTTGTSWTPYGEHGAQAVESFLTKKLGALANHFLQILNVLVTELNVTREGGRSKVICSLELVDEHVDHIRELQWQMTLE